MAIDLIDNPIDNPIDRARTGEGRPAAIAVFESGLNRKQRKLAEQLPDYRSRVTVHKREVSMYDLSAITAVTNAEYALFTCGSRRLVIRGDYRHVELNVAEAAELAAMGYRWSGHTHPGYSQLCLQYSEGDEEILRCFPHERSVIYN